MHIELNPPYEWVTVVDENGYTLRRADPETRAKQLEEYKRTREKELLKELRELEMLY